MKNGFDIMALDKDFKIVSLLNFSLLQWTRKYYEAGVFSVEIPLSQYNNDYKYIYTDARPELGEITQVNYLDTGGYRKIVLSGYFLENELNWRIVYPKGTTNILNNPTYTSLNDNAENVAYRFFNDFKDVRTSNFNAVLGIRSSVSKGRGNVEEFVRDGKELGYTIYSVLQPSEMSYRVSYDFLTNDKVFSVWKGVDRTEENLERNNPVLFNTENGNIRKPNILIDDTKYRNSYIVQGKYTNEGIDYFDILAYSEKAQGENEMFIFKTSSENRNDYSSTQLYKDALKADGHNEKETFPRLINVDFDADSSSYEYMVDFDLGDKCSIDIPEINFSADAVLIGCYEVLKEGKHSLTMEFGTPIIK